MPERLWARCRIKRDAPSPPGLGLGVNTQLPRNAGNGEAVAKQLVEAPFKKQGRRMRRRRMGAGDDNEEEEEEEEKKKKKKKKRKKKKQHHVWW